MRTLLFIAAFFIAFAIIRHLWGRKPRENRPRKPDQIPETMARCDHCGLFMPRWEAVEDRGRLFCCEEHRRHAGRL
ncbi:MAG: hypothetical protein A2286_13575 [Gammaproteobacteria bacterium RIFOXYA12_FULL_61_12]|nr:MAG: hypothetical protein A2514_03885 [Gammaproteobacteria bacterium RIFOXYD12_FULL_61_37]OGT93207.1 MAG: hypothetical protein A2286_13575 [Gammaproteobacteria bacterium RIFOXYA12_FULL_61_12]